MPRNVSSARLPVNAIFIPNGSFEQVPPFTAPTTSSGRWIDGTAAGAAQVGETRNIYAWSFYFKVGTSEVRYDTTDFPDGEASSLKLSTTATGSQVSVSNTIGFSAPAFQRCLFVQGSTQYTFRYHQKTNYVSGDATTGAYLSVVQYDATGTIIGGGTTTGTLIKTTTPWTQRTLTFTTNAAAAFLRIEMSVTGNNGAGTLIMDSWFARLRLLRNATTRTSVV